MIGALGRFYCGSVCKEGPSFAPQSSEQRSVGLVQGLGAVGGGGGGEDLVVVVGEWDGRIKAEEQMGLVRRK